MGFLRQALDRGQPSLDAGTDELEELCNDSAVSRFRGLGDSIWQFYLGIMDKKIW